MMLHEVTGCDDCLFSDDEQWPALCYHPKVPRTVVYRSAVTCTEDGQEPPDECPLRLGELLIALKVRP